MGSLERWSANEADAKKKKKLVVHTKITSKYAHLGPFLRSFVSDNDFSVEHTRARKRQMEGTLERVVKYDKEALDKAWAWMASSPSDGEDD